MVGEPNTTKYAVVIIHLYTKHKQCLTRLSRSMPTLMTFVTPATAKKSQVLSNSMLETILQAWSGSPYDNADSSFNDVYLVSLFSPEANTLRVSSAADESARGNKKTV